jgi:hypothetical protein
MLGNNKKDLVIDALKSLSGYIKAKSKAIMTEELISHLLECSKVLR